MKSKLLIAASLFCMMACKKSYTCVCTSTYTFQLDDGSFYTTVNKGNDSPYSQKMKEKQAKAACKHEEASVQSDYINGATSGGHPFKSGEGITTSCGLK